MKSITILYEDNHLIAVNKPCGISVQANDKDEESLEDLVKAYIKQTYNKPGDVFLGVTHRIDQPVSGIVLFARTSKALERINKIFHDKEIQKTYWAIVKHIPRRDEETLVHYISRNTKLNKSFAHDTHTKNSKEAILSYKLIASSTTFRLLEVQLKTGRHHQIRVQLAKIGCPIKGDLKYGFSRSNIDGGINLHARKLKFIHPVLKTEINIEAPAPDDELWKYFEAALA